jgi:hypothetical protein
MTFENFINAYIVFFLIPIIIGICMTVLILIVLIKANNKSKLSLRNYATGFGACVAANIFAIVISMGYLGAYSYIILCGPLMIFGFMLTKELINDKRSRNLFIRLFYKSIAIILIWFMAFFPFSLFGVAEIISIPTKNAVKQEVLQLQEEILNSETYADLTPFGLGIYKLQDEGSPLLGSPFLWDITQLEDGNTRYGDTRIIYGTSRNLKSEETWDDLNRGTDVLYEVYQYEGIYIIIIPDKYYTYDTPRFYINICKDLSNNADLFQVVVYNQETITKLRELPGEKIPRRELIERLGKTKWEDVPRTQPSDIRRSPLDD